MMLVQTSKASRITLLDRQGHFELHNHINDRRLSIIRPFKATVREMQFLMNVENAKRIIQLGGLPNEVRDGWYRMIEGFVRNGVAPEHEEAIRSAGEKMRTRIERRRKQEYEPVSVATKKWIDDKTATLIKDLSVAQMANAQAIIHHQVIWGVTSPYQLAQIMKPAIGLTEREAVACSRYYSGLLEEGVGQRVATAQLDKYANYLHRTRADRIARTELSDAYNFGQWDSVNSARESGLIEGEVEKSWLAGGAKPCDICLGNEADGPIPMDQSFSSGDDMPTAHPSCACSLGYQVRR